MPRLFRAGLLAAVLVPLALAMTSPLLQWRDPVYIAAGLFGILALGLMLCQPLLAAGLVPDLPLATARRLHRWVGATVLAAVILHVIGLWITSPPDVIDVLIFRSPTPFGIWGAVGFYALFATALLVATRRRFRNTLRFWRIAHTALAMTIVTATILHTLLIEGTMQVASKWVLSAVVVAALAAAILRLRVWK